MHMRTTCVYILSISISICCYCLDVMCMMCMMLRMDDSSSGHSCYDIFALSISVTVPLLCVCYYYKSPSNIKSSILSIFILCILLSICRCDVEMALVIR